MLTVGQRRTTQNIWRPASCRMQNRTWYQAAVSLHNVERLSWDTARDLDAYLVRGMK